MKLAVITPVGPGHEAVAQRAMASVDEARGRAGRFTIIRHVIVEDYHGLLGRSRARNIGMETAADWYFFLDADDMMRPDALELFRDYASAMFGAVSLRTGQSAKNIYPCGWREIALHGARGTLSMGFFCRADVARRLQFDETLDAGEDFDFYLRLDNFTKIERPLVDIGYDLPSATGPRGYAHIDWVGICNEMTVKAVEKEPEKYDLGGDAVLAKAGDSQSQSGVVPQSLSA